MYYSGYADEFRVLPHSLSVHVLEEVSRQEKIRWVKKDGCSMADRVLFLGSPSSFVVDASLLGGHGGCAYFIYHNDGKRSPGMRYGVLRYNLVSAETDFVYEADFIERLPLGWDSKMCTWLIPQPMLTPIKVNTFKTPRIYLLHNTIFH